MHLTLAPLTFLFPLLTDASPFHSHDLSPRAVTAPKRDPWVVTRLSANSPSGRPGSAPWCYVRFSIEDQNTLDAGMSPYGHVYTTPGSANCTAKWDCYDKNAIWDKEMKCGEESVGHWTWWMREPTNILGGLSTTRSATANFDLEWKLESKIMVLVGNDNRLVEQVFSGRYHFQVGDNMSGSCGGSGVCGWGLAGKSVLVEPKMTKYMNGTENRLES